MTRKKPKVIVSVNNEGLSRSWNVSFGGRTQPLKEFDTQASAREYGIEVSKQFRTDFLMQGLDGRFRENNTYPRSRDPRNIKG